MIYSLANDVNIKPSVQVGNDATYSECGPAGHYSSVDNALYGPTNNAAKPPQGGDQVTPRGKVVANQLYSPLPWNGALLTSGRAPLDWTGEQRYHLECVMGLFLKTNHWPTRICVCNETTIKQAKAKLQTFN